MPPVEVHYPVGLSELERVCWWQPNQHPEAVACGGGELMAFNWAWWIEQPVEARCMIWVHERGHTLGLKHEDPIFIGGEARGHELCRERFGLKDWARPARARPKRRPNRWHRVARPTTRDTLL